LEGALKRKPALQASFRDGSDGTGTRDLQRDRTATGTNGKNQWLEDGLSYLS